VISALEELPDCFGVTLHDRAHVGLLRGRQGANGDANPQGDKDSADKRSLPRHQVPPRKSHDSTELWPNTLKQPSPKCAVVGGAIRPDIGVRMHAGRRRLPAITPLPVARAAR
jgi:hypothetical protein